MDDAVVGIYVRNDDFGIIIDKQRTIKRFQTSDLVVGHGHVDKQCEYLIRVNFAAKHMIQQDIGQFRFTEGAGDIAGIEAQFGESIIGWGEDRPFVTRQRLSQTSVYDRGDQRFAAAVLYSNVNNRIAGCSIRCATNSWHVIVSTGPGAQDNGVNDMHNAIGSVDIRYDYLRIVIDIE